jgi:hypothetical protein
MQVIFVDINLPFLLDRIVKNITEIKVKANEMMQMDGKEVPGHMTLSNLQEILKMRPSPTPNDDNDQNDITTFIFVMESLARLFLERSLPNLPNFYTT